MFIWHKSFFKLFIFLLCRYQYIIRNIKYEKSYSFISKWIALSSATRIRTWKMTESESVALPFGDSASTFVSIHNSYKKSKHKFHFFTFSRWVLLFHRSGHQNRQYQEHIKGQNCGFATLPWNKSLWCPIQCLIRLQTLIHHM